MKQLFAVAIACLSLVMLCPAAEIPTTSTPNIVIIYIDDMGYADIGPFGAKGYSTPNLDRMAAEGMKFTSFYSAQPICSASRSSLMTGCYANRVGFSGALMPHNKWGISSNEMTIAQVCKQKGYATAAFGKWHLGDAIRFLPLQHGFDEYFGLPYSNDMTPHPRWQGDSQEQPFIKLPLINQNTVVNPDVDDAAQDMLTTWYTEHAVSFIHRHKDRPFFLYVPHAMVHVPLHVSDKFRGKTERGLFGDVVEELDWSVGQILAAIKEDGLDNNTLVMFCSDNGPWLAYGDHAGSAYPLREGKGTSWDGGVREPTLMRWPGRIPAGRVCDAPLCTIDMLPTIASLIGAPLPPHKIDGLDISRVMLGQTSQSPHDVLYFYYHLNDLEALRSGKWKLELARQYRSLDGKPGGKGGRPAPYSQLKIPQPELYDLDVDPGEQNDVAAGNPEVMKKLVAYAEQAREDLGDNLTRHKGAGRRQHEVITDGSGIYPSDAAFPKAFDAKYWPGRKLPHETGTKSTETKPVQTKGTSE
ncbi:MAG TPA: sulfatase [Verrucomicrobiae bacterium]|jgi:arylsulfatase|nr:sulfatase [Verrucomicrobiae bacterium]